MAPLQKTVARIGLIGCGSRGTRGFGRILSTREDVELVAVADTNPVRMEAAKRILKREFVAYTDVEEMLGHEKLDGVIITTPDFLHTQQVLLAIHHGLRHILVDKPLATTAQDALLVARATRETGAQVLVGFNLRHMPILARVKAMVQNGELGELMLMENRLFYDIGRTYMARWNRFSALSGGLWVHKGSHDFDIFNWLNEGGNPDRVYASGGLNALRSDKLPFQLEAGKAIGPTCSVCAYGAVCPDKYVLENSELYNEETARCDGYHRDLCLYLSEKDTHDNGIALVEYDNNVRASHLESFVCNFSDRYFTISGTLGSVEVRTSQPERILFRPRWGGDRAIIIPSPVQGIYGGADRLLVQHFVASILGKMEPASTVRDGLRAVAVGQAAEVSWRERRSVPISEFVDLFDPALRV